MLENLASVLFQRFEQPCLLAYLMSGIVSIFSFIKIHLHTSSKQENKLNPIFGNNIIIIDPSNMKWKLTGLIFYVTVLRHLYEIYKY
jgi:Kef-type K+ transport system membrane component KefB